MPENLGILCPVECQSVLRGSRDAFLKGVGRDLYFCVFELLTLERGRWTAYVRFLEGKG